MNDIELLYVDLFCGAGGTSTGVESAKINGVQCAKVIACVNHDKNAIASHAANHPEAIHFTEDMRTLNIKPLVSHTNEMRKKYPNAKVVLWASLECTNFSKAKGGQPRDADSRTLADHLDRYIEAINPDLIKIENVEEFMSWGPMDKNGKPISMQKGKDYTRWLKKVKSYGYNFDYRILNAADFGAYTSRKRYFGIFAKDGLPILFPDQTHSKEEKHDLGTCLKKWKPVKDVLDFEDEGVSIFARKKELVEATKTRIYSGLIKFVAGGKESFMIKYNSMSQSGKYQAPDLDSPSSTVSCQNRLGIAKVSFISKQFSGHPESKNVSIDQPAGAITCIDHHAIVNTRFLSAYYGTGNNVSHILNPCPTVPTKDRFNYVTPKFFANYYSAGGQLSDINAPCPGLTVNPKQRLITPRFIDQQYGQSKPASINQPLGCVTANPKYALVTPWLMNTSFSNIGSSLETPSPVVTANRKWHYLVNPQYNSAGSSVNAPCFTLIARMDKMPPYLAECTSEIGDNIPSFIKQSGNTLVYEIYSTDSPMTVKIKEFMALYGIIDIKMRMLKIPELKRIMGFPDKYKLIGTQAEKKKYIGNAVEVTMARVLCETTCRKLRELKKLVA